MLVASGLGRSPYAKSRLCLWKRIFEKADLGCVVRSRRAALGRPPTFSLLVDTLTRVFEALKDIVKVIWEYHELLQTFHANACHLCGEVTVEELCYAAFGIARQHCKTLLKELIRVHA